MCTINALVSICWYNVNVCQGFGPCQAAIISVTVYARLVPGLLLFQSVPGFWSMLELCPVCYKCNSVRQLVQYVPEFCRTCCCYSVCQSCAGPVVGTVCQGFGPCQSCARLLLVKCMCARVLVCRPEMPELCRAAMSVPVCMCQCWFSVCVPGFWSTRVVPGC